MRLLENLIKMKNLTGLNVRSTFILNFCLLNLFFYLKFPLFHLNFFFFFFSSSFNFLSFNFFFNFSSFNGNFSRLISKLRSSFDSRSNSSSRNYNSFWRFSSNSSHNLLRNMESLDLLWYRRDNFSDNSSFNILFFNLRSNISFSSFRNVLSLLFFNKFRSCLLLNVRFSIIFSNRSSFSDDFFLS